ncbi:MAG TPA: hypothetical protein GX715_08080 [Armatimonadetes bacterium]|nr:hypothetical protein [Armatimonadota bacterium]
MRCERIQEELPAYLEGDLSGRALRRVERHLSECEACRRESRALRRTVELLHPLGGRAIPRDVTALVMARLPPPEAPVREVRRPRPLLLVPAMLAVAVALALSLATHVPSRKRVNAEAPRTVYLREYAQFRASQEVGDSTGLFLLASEMVREAQ